MKSGDIIEPTCFLANRAAHASHVAMCAFHVAKCWASAEPSTNAARFSSLKQGMGRVAPDRKHKRTPARERRQAERGEGGCSHGAADPPCPLESEAFCRTMVIERTMDGDSEFENSDQSRRTDPGVQTHSQSHPFDRLVRRDNNAIRLGEAALLFALDRYGDMKVGRWLSRLDGLARRVDQVNARTPADQVDALRTVLVDEEGLTGNLDTYDDPRNSYLNEVLTRGLGIPISLSVVWLDVCGQLGWPFGGVGLPGHYIIKSAALSDEVLIDVFRGGQVLDRADCERIVSTIHRRPVTLTSEHFVVSTTRETLSRMLNNLRLIYVERQAWYQAACVISRMLALDPDAADLHQQLNRVAGHQARLN